METKGKFYIYYHIDPRDGLPKYIGKGSGRRAWEFSKKRRNKKHFNWIKSLKKQNLEPQVFIGKKFENEQDCFDAEMKDISFLRKIGVGIKNIANGGQGVRLNIDIIQRRAKKRQKAVICLNNNTEYSSIIECAKILNLVPSRISAVLTARKRTCKGYKFLYKQEELNEKYVEIRKKKEKWFDHTTGIRVVCLENNHIYETLEQLAQEIGVSGAYVSKKFKDRLSVNIKGMEYKRI